MSTKQAIELRPKVKRFRSLVVEQAADVSDEASCYADVTARIKHWLILKNNDWYAKWRFRVAYALDSLGALCCNTGPLCSGGAADANKAIIVTGIEPIRYWAGVQKDIAQSFCWRCGADERNLNIAVHFRAEPDDVTDESVDEIFVAYIENI